MEIIQHKNFSQKWHCFSLLVISYFLIACDLDAQIRNPDQLIEAHMQALGGYEKYKAINNLTFVGVYEEPRFKQVHRFDRKRPNLIRVTTNYDESTGTFGYCEGYDGAAWEYSSKIPVRVVGEPARALRNASQFEPSYIDYKFKGYTARYNGIHEINGYLLHHLEIIRSAERTDNFFFDKESLMLTFNSGNAPFHGEGKTIEIVEIRSDFRPVNGVLMPHRFEQRSGEKVLSSLVWDKIEANTDVADEWFSPPLSEKQLMFKSFRESMIAGNMSELSGQYQEYQRLSVTQFRQALENELNTFGYELISYERYKDAIKVFKMAISEHPNSVNLHDSLGEVYLMDGDTTNAIRYYRKVLALNPGNSHATDVLKNIVKD